ncbi:efflux RND transporter permease subunit [Candidatus Paracaedibacter symbiosus]|uniref:efflux RND transporter permease subunit n=1 Tax=Candidatus Paracaedibacter symbiosus TaxID=244582 RepID=UPI0006910AD1|nr:efflux RND transporter permease subunit [Candidatus Paracaedibacter symbiosus]
MKLSEVCIQRPVFSWVMTIVLLLVGLVGFSRLPLQQYPTVERPYITIESTLQGAAPEIVEAQVTRVIEEAVAGIEGVVSVSSTSSVDDSKVVMEFSPGRRVEDAANDIRDRLNKAKDRLPHEMNEPILTKSKADDKAIMTLALTSDKLAASELADFALREIQKDLESISGVARVDVLGGDLYKMRLKLDPVKLAAFNITVAEVIQAIKQQNIEKPAGKLISNDREYLVTTVADIETPEEFNDLPIMTRDGHLVYLSDLGAAEMSANDKKTKTRFNGKTGISIGIMKQTIANPIDVAREVKKMMPSIQQHLPDSMTLSLGTDRTRFIEESVSRIYWTIGEATVLVVLVVFLFLRSARASIIPLITIPVSLIGTLFIMYLLGFSLNRFTLMAMVMAIGLVVDDAIVVLENVYRYIDEGEKPFNAAVKGVREISFAIVAMTLTLVAVYAPIALSKGTVGKYFTEFAVTLAGSVLLSGFAALTLSPMMCARLLGQGEGAFAIKSAGWWEKLKEKVPTDVWLDKLETEYARFLRLILSQTGENSGYHSSYMTIILYVVAFLLAYVIGGLFSPVIGRIIAMVIAFAILLLVDPIRQGLVNWMMKVPYKPIFAGFIVASIGMLSYYGLPKELFPTEDQGAIFIDGQSAQSATLQYTDKFVSQLDEVLSTIPEIERRITQINNPTYDVSIQLKDDRSRSTAVIEAELKAKLAKITGISVKFEGSGGSSDRSDLVEFIIGGNKTHREIKELSRLTTNKLYGNTNIAAVLSNDHPDTEDFTVYIRRDKAAEGGVEPGAIADTIDSLVRGRKASSFKRENKLYDVLVEVMDQARQSPKDITNLFMKANDKKQTLIPLAELVEVKARSGPAEIFRYNRVRAISHTVKLQSGIGQMEGINMVKEITKSVLPRDARMEFTGDTRRFMDESQNMYLIFGMALIFIYLIMAAQFESWIDPAIIMFSVPLSLASAVVTLTLIKGGTINVYSQIGLVTLIGLITKHGILMVDVANHLRTEGVSKLDAIVEASKVRLRPILMTTFAMVLGSVPLALSQGAGAESYRQIGWVIVGGMTIGTLFTLLVLPAIYLTLSQNKRKQMQEIAI